MRALRTQFAAQPAPQPDVLILEGGAAPENMTGALRRFQPDLVILIDAAALDAPPGTIHCLDWRQIDGMSGSTHTLPLDVLCQFLVDSLGCTVVLLGIQPDTLPSRDSFDQPPSPAVQRAVEEIVSTLPGSL